MEQNAQPSPTIQAICAREGLPPGGLRPLSGGQINTIFFVPGPPFERVLRVVRGPADSYRLLQEADLLRRLRAETAVPVPEILAAGEQNGLAYQVQRRLPGQKLHRLWPALSLEQKDRVLSQLGAHLAALHGVRCDRIGCERFGWQREPGEGFSRWLDYVEPEFHAAVETIARTSQAFPSALLRLAEQFFAETRPLLEDASPVLVHADLWPGNILVDGDQISAILDFEFALRGPREYELVLLEDFCLFPNDFIEPDFQPRASADYADFIPLLRRHYPALFADPGCRRRLRFYHLLFNLQLYAGWRKNNPLAEEGGYLLAKLARIVNALFPNGVRMFAEDGWSE